MTLYQEIRTAYSDFEKERILSFKQTLEISEQFLLILDESLEEHYHIWKYPYDSVVGGKDCSSYFILRGDYKALNPNPGIITYLSSIFNISTAETSTVLGILPRPQPLKNMVALPLVITPNTEGFSVWFGMRNYLTNLPRDAMKEEKIANSLEKLKKIVENGLRGLLLKNMQDINCIARDAYSSILPIYPIEEASKLEFPRKITGFTSE